MTKLPPRKIRGIRDPVDAGKILGRPKNMGRGPAVQMDAPPGLFGPNRTIDVLGGLPASGVTAGTYGDSGNVSVITVDAKGRVTAASEAAIAAGTGNVTGPGTSTAGNLTGFFDASGEVIEDLGVSIDTDGTLAADSDGLVPTQKAVKTYVDANAGGAFSGCQVKKASDQTAANYSAGANITWDTEVYDVGGWHESVTNPSRITVPAGVTYAEFTGVVSVQNATASSHSVYIFKNGSLLYTYIRQSPNIGGSTQWAGSFNTGAIAVAQNDYFEINYTDSDASIDVMAAWSYFSARKVA